MESLRCEATADGDLVSSEAVKKPATDSRPPRHTASMLMTSLKAQKSAATREEILAVCMKLFSRRGFGSTTIADIADAAGITKGAIYWHFESKEALFAAILEDIRMQWKHAVVRNVLAAPTTIAKVEQLFDNYAALLDEKPEVC